MANVGGSDPYAGITYGYGIGNDGVVYANDNLCYTDYIEIPAGLTSEYLLTYFAGPYIRGSNNLGNFCACLYDENKNMVGYVPYNIVNRTRGLTDPTYKYIRATFYIPTLDTSFLRITNEDAVFSYIDLFTGVAFPPAYKNVLYGYYRNNTGLVKNISTGGNGSSCCIGYYSPISIPASTQSVEMNIGPGIIISSGTTELGWLLMLDAGYAVLNRYTQNAAPRVMTDNRFGTTWLFTQKNSFSKLIDTTYLLDVTNNNYLFKGLDVQ